MSNDLFEKLIRLWRQRKNPTEALTPQEIAFHLFGKGSPENVTKTLHVLWGFKSYFTPPSSYGKKWRVNWTNVQRDYPDLVDMAPKTSGPLEGMMQALEDEIRAVKKDMQEHPFWAQITADLGAAGEGAFLYEAWLELPTDSELPIPEGVGIWLQWPASLEKSIVEATLLNYDAINGKIIVEVLEPLSSQHVKSRLRVLPRVDELLKAVKGKLESLNSKRDALTWRLLTGNVVPRPHLWNGNHDPQGLDTSQLSVVQKCLGADISFIWGPPGTGKTYTLGKLIAQAALAGKRIIATSIANVAVDNLALQVLRALESSGAAGHRLVSSGHLIRFGHPRLSEVIKEARLFPHKEEIQELRRQLHDAVERHQTIPATDTVARALSNKRIKEIRDEIRRRTKEILDQSSIILTTAIQVCIEPLLTEVGFDAMVIDEASMMPIPILACMGLVGRERLVVAGDFRQLGPIAVSQSKAAFEWLHKDAFELVGIKNNLNHPALGMLTNQRRMHADICDIVNRHFYDNKLTTQVDAKKTAASALPPLRGKSAVLVAYLPDDGSQSEQTENGSRLNRGSAQIAAALSAAYVKSELKVKVGLITPYRAQVALVKRLLKDMKLPAEQSDRIIVGTVHAFQGAEADIIICDLVDSHDQPIGKLYKGDTGNRLVNVAISRAQGKLVLIGDPDTFLNGSGYQAVDRFRNILSLRFSVAQGNVIQAKDLGIRSR